MNISFACHEIACSALFRLSTYRWTMQLVWTVWWGSLTSCAQPPPINWDIISFPDKQIWNRWSLDQSTENRFFLLRKMFFSQTYDNQNTNPSSMWLPSPFNLWPDPEPETLELLGTEYCQYRWLQLLVSITELIDSVGPNGRALNQQRVNENIPCVHPFRS